MPLSSDNTTNTRRKRLQLSCGECRKKKLSCDRAFPCRRCVRTGRSDQCSFETETGQPPISNSQLAQQSANYSNEVQELRAEVAQLKSLLSESRLQHENNFPTALKTVSLGNDTLLSGQERHENVVIEKRSVSDLLNRTIEGPDNLTNPAIDVSDPRKRSSSRYYSQHTLLQFFTEVRHV